VRVFAARKTLVFDAPGVKVRGVAILIWPDEPAFEPHCLKRIRCPRHYVHESAVMSKLVGSHVPSFCLVSRRSSQPPGTKCY
jgi:hypothetical protein